MDSQWFQNGEMTKQPPNLLRNSSSGIDLARLYQLPASLNLQPNNYMKTNNEFQSKIPSGPPLFGMPHMPGSTPVAPAATLTPVAPVAAAAPAFTPVSPTSQEGVSFPPLIAGEAHSLKSMVSVEEPGPVSQQTSEVSLADPQSPDLNIFGVFEKNSQVVERFLSQDELHFSPIKTSETETDEKSSQEKVDIQRSKSDQNLNTTRKGVFRWGNFAKKDETDADDLKEKTDDIDLGIEKFAGEGQIFKAKLIGFCPVKSSKDFEECQNAIQELKQKVRASGEHKRKISFHVTVDGLQIKDEKTGESLFTHAINKVSYLVHDIHDHRAFGYTVVSSENEATFFGIKTEKAASLTIQTLSDLFKTVFELKKKVEESPKTESKDLLSEVPEHEKSVASFPADVSDANEEEVALEKEKVPQALPEKLTSSLTELLGLQLEPVNPNNFNQLGNGPSMSGNYSHLAFSNPFASSFEVPKTQIDSSIFDFNPVYTSASFSQASNGSFSDSWAGVTSTVTPQVGSQTPLQPLLSSPMEEKRKLVSSNGFNDPFKDLDPLGTGTSKPYVDPKEFFKHAKPPAPNLASLAVKPEESKWPIFSNDTNVNLSAGQTSLLDF